MTGLDLLFNLKISLQKKAGMKNFINQINFQKLYDVIAISLSGICAVHCLLTPIALIVFPIVGTTVLTHELFHRLMFFLILPTSLLAFFLGCSQHKDRAVIFLGVLGFAILFFGAFWGHGVLGISKERILTLAGGGIMAAGHVRNFRLCRQTSCGHDHHHQIRD